MIERNAHGRDFNKNRFLVPSKWLAVVLTVAVSIMTSVQVHGQILRATGPLPSFEVATIKPGQPGATGIRAFGPKGVDRFLAMNVTVKDLIDFAYTVKPGFLETRVGRTAATGATMSMLAEVLERQDEVGNPPGGRGRIVVDKTNLSGRYDWTLHWTPWQDLSSGELSDSKGPSLFTVLQEQLGLKLERAKGKVDVVVIDHIDLPSEN